MKMKKVKYMIAIIGYGSQGKALAQNLRDSGMEVIIALPTGSRSRKLANKDGFAPVKSISKAVNQSNIICFAFPDHLHGRVYEKEIKNNLNSGSCLWFLHGTSVHFGFVKPPDGCDVILVAPHGPGVAVREKFLSDKDMSAFIAVHQNATGKALKIANNLAGGVGFQKNKLVSTTFEMEAIGDLFGEQAVLCGGLAALIKAGYDTLVNNKFPPENAYLEIAYQLDLIIELIKKYGIDGMFERISVAARYGSLLSGPRIIDKSAKKKMNEIFKEIKTGQFPEKLNLLSDKDIIKIKQSLKSFSSPDFEDAVKKFSSNK